jgi:hypothetical protein
MTVVKFKHAFRLSIPGFSQFFTDGNLPFLPKFTFVFLSSKILKRLYIKQKERLKVNHNVILFLILRRKIKIAGKPFDDSRRRNRPYSRRVQSMCRYFFIVSQRTFFDSGFDR